MKGYFYVNDIIFSSELNLSSNARLVYIYLCKCANNNNESWPAHSNIAAACSICVTSVRTALRELEDNNIVSKTNRYSHGGGRTSNLYKINNRLVENSFKCEQNIFAAKLSGKSKLVYLFFCRLSNNVGTCFPAHKTIAAACVASVSTVRNAILELVAAGLVSIKSQRRKNDPGQTSNLYTLLKPVIDEAVAIIEKTCEVVCEKIAQITENNAQKQVAAVTSTGKNGLWTYINSGVKHILRGALLKCDDKLYLALRNIHS